MSNALITQLNNPVVLQQINRRLAAVTSLLLVIACAYLLVKVTWLFFPQDEGAVAVSTVNSRPVAVNNNAQQNNFRKLKAANVFGKSEAAAVRKQTTVPETKLNLTLKGVLAAKPMELASAIIAKGKNGKEDVYSVGEKMPGGILIKEIYPDHVVLQRNGRLETLKLQKISGAGGFGGIGAKRSIVSSGNFSSPAAALKNIRKSILKNPASFGEYALPIIVKEKGKQIGYRLQPQKKGQLLSELGLQPSDVIVQINGVKLNKAKNGIAALRKLSSAKTLNLVIKRNGAEIPIDISMP